MNMHVRTLGPAPAERAYRLALQERKSRKALKRLAVIRERARDEIDRLIAFLDETDGFTLSEIEADDAEPTNESIRHVGTTSLPEGEDAEPSLCGLSVEQRFAVGNCQWGADREDECEDEGADGADDREDVCEDEGAEHDGREPDEDGEPSLCGVHADDLNRFSGWLRVEDGEREEVRAC